MPVENHPLQKTFRPGDTSLLRNKQGRCRRCDKAQKPGEKFMFCKGCNVALYCSAECQRAHWDHHKPLCKYQQENTAIMAAHPEAVAPRASGLPSILEMQSYLRDFTEIHRPSFQGLIHARMQSMGGTEKVLTEEPKVCLVPLKYRHPGPEGINPALTFTLSSLVFLPLQRVLSDAATNRPRFTEAWEASTASRAHAKALFSDDPGFVDILPILFAPHAGPTQFAYSPQYRTLTGDMIPELPDSARSQIEMYSAFIELGIVMRPPGKDAPPVPGYMKRLNDGKKWEWRPLWKNWYVDPAWTTSSMKERIKLLKRKLAEAQRSS